MFSTSILPPSHMVCEWRLGGSTGRYTDMAQGDIRMPTQMIQATFATTLAVLIIGANSNTTAAAFKNCPDYIFAFGNSYTDTGNSQEELPILFSLNPPYGISYRFPDRPNEQTRFCDGRITIDFTSMHLHIMVLELWLHSSISFILREHLSIYRCSGWQQYLLKQFIR